MCSGALSVLRAAFLFFWWVLHASTQGEGRLDDLYKSLSAAQVIVTCCKNPPPILGTSVPLGMLKKCKEDGVILWGTVCRWSDGSGTVFWVLRRCRKRTGKKWTTDSGFLAHFRSGMDLRAAAVVDDPGSTCQAKLQNSKLVTPELVSLASKVIKFSCPPRRTHSICTVNAIHRYCHTWPVTNSWTCTPQQHVFKKPVLATCQHSMATA